ncbi:hypothetical protein CEUSTIGMA_g2007.t1 [Chlamydomonas eustigma]|uniref:Uncharacterized protein n=1 Tax=Chlamydomonas eustigma TaxID=1157962 RepID=A0A250WUR4_9CHLO|nr:hypothetical protein CEUSTIGMA_g2007.t1 [Chlamydomonas eustigma]|eukprot:GAX74558.1 hypothetical protein CEUSTIGMA_g2007.t1 [Chlamydomonas eustigma]
MRDFVSTVNSLLQHQDNHQVGLIAAMSHFTRKLEVAIAAITAGTTPVKLTSLTAKNVDSWYSGSMDTDAIRTILAAYFTQLKGSPTYPDILVHLFVNSNRSDLINFMAAKVVEFRQELSAPVQAPTLTTPGKLAFLTQREEQLIDEIVQFIKGTGSRKSAYAAAAVLTDMEVDEDAVDAEPEMVLAATTNVPPATTPPVATRPKGYPAKQHNVGGQGEPKLYEPQLKMYPGTNTIRHPVYMNSKIDPKLFPLEGCPAYVPKGKPIPRLEGNQILKDAIAEYGLCKACRRERHLQSQCMYKHELGSASTGHKRQDGFSADTKGPPYKQKK